MSVELVVPKLGESITEATISRWLKQVGEHVAADEPVVDLETDKVTIALPAPAAGVLAEQRHAVGAVVKVGDVVGGITPGAAPAVKVAAPVDKAPAPVEKSPASVDKAPAPVAAPAGKAAAPLAASAGHGSAAVVPRSSTKPPSVRKALREGAAMPATISGNGQQARGHADEEEDDAREEVIPMSPLRRRIAQRLVEAQHTAAILTTFNEVDMTSVMALRARYQDDFVKKHGLKLGFMSFFVKACVESLKQWPGVNAEVRGSDVVYKKHYDIGVAVGGGKGLVVPVVRNCDEMNFAQIEKAISDFAVKAKDNKLTLDELSGGTFTISNGGIYGSMMSTPLLNMPQTGILGMHNITKRPMVVGDKIEIRPMMYIALSYDHRVVDGREAVSFLVSVKDRIESPERLLLSV